MITDLRGGLIRTSAVSTKPSAWSCSWLRAISSTNTSWTENGIRTALRIMICGCQLMRYSIWTASVCSLESQWNPGLHQKKRNQQGKGRNNPLLFQSLWVLHLEYHVRFCSLQHKTWSCWSESRGGHEKDQRTGGSLLLRKVEGVSFVTSWKREDFRKNSSVLVLKGRLRERWQESSYQRV